MMIRSLAGVSLALLALSAHPAASATLNAPVGRYVSNGGGLVNDTTLVVATADKAGEKGAGFVVHTAGLVSTNPGTDVIAGFATKAEWTQFSALWTKARGTKPPSGGATDVGDFADKTDQVLLRVYVLPSGVIEFGIAAKGTATLFDLVPMDFAAFDASVQSVSDYFAH